MSFIFSQDSSIDLYKIRTKNSLDIVASKKYYIWDTVPIADIATNKIVVNKNNTCNFISLYRSKKCGEAIERHYGAGHALLRYDQKNFTAHKYLEPDLVERIDSRPVHSYHTGSYYKLHKGPYKYIAFITRARYDRNGFLQDILPVVMRKNLHDVQILYDRALRPDNKIYMQSTVMKGTTKSSSFRDPYVYKDGNAYKMIFAASNNTSNPPYNACVGLAKSNNLVDWTLDNPLFISDKYVEMDLPQVISINDSTILLFSTKPTEVKNGKKGDSTLRAYDLGTMKEINTVLPPEIYATRVFDVKGNAMYAMGIIENTEQEGCFTYPFKLIFKDDTIVFTHI